MKSKSPHSKTMRKIIRYKQHNRRISAILKYMTKEGGNLWSDKYFGNGKYFGWKRIDLEVQVSKNGGMILHLRKKMGESK